MRITLGAVVVAAAIWLAWPVSHVRHSDTAAAPVDTGVQDGGTLARRLEEDVATLNPICATSAYELTVAKYLFTPLIYLDAKAQPVAGLAKSWTVKDGRIYQFKLNERATFSDDRPVLASDVIFTLGKVADSKSGAALIADSFRDIEYTREIDPGTVEVAFKRPLATQLTRFADLFILPKHIYGSGNFRADFNMTAIGSGPYRLVRRTPDREIVLERRDDYWDRKPHIQKVIFTVLGHPVTAWNALKKGSIDEAVISSGTWVLERSNAALQRGLTFRIFYTRNYSFVAWNGRRPIFRDKRVRRALAHGIPVTSIAGSIYNGTAQPISGPFTPGEDACDATIAPIQYAPQDAKQQLASAGWTDHNRDGYLDKNGVKLAFELLVPSETLQPLAQILKEEWRKIGVAMEINTMKSATAFARIREGNYDAALLEWTLDADPDLYSKFHSSQVPPHGMNFVFYQNAEVDRLIERARVEVDRKKQQQLHWRLHAILAQDQPYAWTLQTATKWVVNKRVRGVELSPVSGPFQWYPGEFAWWIASEDRGAQP